MARTIIAALITSYIVANLESPVNANPNGRLLSLPQGRIKGRLSETRNGSFFMEYFGIPYAMKPHRFKVARWPPPKWNDTRDATRRASPCFQMRGNVSIGSEDCLFLNVHTPAQHNTFKILKKLPVIVAFHGGSWMVGRGPWLGGESGQIGAKHMMDEAVVLVTVNYRLGVFGFISFSREDGPSNLGLKDQVMSLKWVQKYIHLFGGDPNRVTILGQGAGAAAVGLHILSPLSKGLFHRAIMQSGSPLCHWALLDDVNQIGMGLYIQEVGCGTGEGEELSSSILQQILDCLILKTPEELETARQNIMGVHSDPYYPFGPVVEHWVRSVPKLKVFLPDYPLNILLNSTNSTWGGIPILMGVNSQDGLNFVTGQYMINPGVAGPYFANFTKSYPANFGYGPSRTIEKAKTVEDQEKVTQQVREFYYQNISVEKMKDMANSDIHVGMYSHRNYFQCVKNAAVLYGKWSDVYLYYWNRTGSSFKDWHSFDRLKLSNGVAHGDEMQYLFDTSDDFGDFKLIRYARPKHLPFSMNTVKVWVGFAGAGKVPDDSWQSMKGKDKSSLKWYEFGEERKLIPEPFTKYTDFWDNLGLDEPRALPPPGEVKLRQLARKFRVMAVTESEIEVESEEVTEAPVGFMYIDLEE